MRNGERPLEGKVVVVTGASTGIGRETALGLARQGARVVMSSKNPERAAKALEYVKAGSGNDTAELILSDFASMASVNALADTISQRHPKVDVLVNNAGIWSFSHETTEDGYESTFAVNHLATFLLTHRLLGNLKAAAPSRVVTVSSNVHRAGNIHFDDLHMRKKFSGYRAYANSKLANIHFAYELARRLEGTGVASNCVHPGPVRTSLFKQNKPWFIKLAASVFQYLPILLSPTKGAATSLHVASHPELEGVTGKYFVKKKPVDSSPRSYDDAVAKRLWEVSEEMTGIA